jgi:hypothetical protein
LKSKFNLDAWFRIYNFFSFGIGLDSWSHVPSRYSPARRRTPTRVMIGDSIAKATHKCIPASPILPFSVSPTAAPRLRRGRRLQPRSLCGRWKEWQAAGGCLTSPSGAAPNPRLHCSSIAPCSSLAAMSIHSAWSLEEGSGVVRHREHERRRRADVA